MAIALDDLEPKLQYLLTRMQKHPGITVAFGMRSVIIFTRGEGLHKRVESKIPEEYRSQVYVVLTRRPKYPHEPAPENRKRTGTSRRW